MGAAVSAGYHVLGLLIVQLGRFSVGVDKLFFDNPYQKPDNQKQK
jgi:hypothetical protein